MKKAFLFAVIIGLIYTGSTTPASAYVALYSSQGWIYYIGASIDYCPDFYCWEATVYADGDAASCLIFLDKSTQNNRTMKITVFENDEVYGWTLEGNLHITGGGSDMKGLVNTGTFFNSTLYVVYFAIPPLEILKSRSFESGASLIRKPHAPAKLSTP